MQLQSQPRFRVEVSNCREALEVDCLCKTPKRKSDHPFTFCTCVEDFLIGGGVKDKHLEITIDENGSNYSGEMANYVPHGHGCLDECDADKNRIFMYCGSWVEGKAHGQGDYDAENLMVGNGSWCLGELIKDSGETFTIAPTHIKKYFTSGTLHV